MNPIVTYAIEHQAKAKAMLLGSYRIPFDDVDDIVQDAIVRICQARPLNSTNPSSYWWMAVRSAAIHYLRRRPSLPLLVDRPDPRQDPEAIACQREDFAEAWQIATPAQRKAIVARLAEQRGEQSNSTKANICRLRRRLRERAAA